jgi:hypothetical protein
LSCLNLDRVFTNIKVIRRAITHPLPRIWKALFSVLLSEMIMNQFK